MLISCLVPRLLKTVQMKFMAKIQSLTSFRPPTFVKVRFITLRLPVQPLSENAEYQSCPALYSCQRSKYSEKVQGTVHASKRVFEVRHEVAGTLTPLPPGKSMSSALQVWL